MKKIIIFILAVIFCSTVFSQKKEEHLQKSRRLNTAAWIFAGSGTALAVGGMILLIHADSRQNDYNDRGEGNLTAAIAGLGLTVIGIAAIGTSIPFFIRGHKEHKRGMSFSFKNEKIQLLPTGIFTRQVCPALSLQISL
jgi:hypothetical protein